MPSAGRPSSEPKLSLNTRVTNVSASLGPGRPAWTLVGVIWGILSPFSAAFAAGSNRASSLFAPSDLAPCL